MLTIGICDDEKEIRDKIKNVVKKKIPLQIEKFLLM